MLCWVFHLLSNGINIAWATSLVNSLGEQMRSQMWKCSKGVAWMRWRQWCYCSGLGIQNMKGPCHPVVFNSQSPWRQTHQTQKHWERALRLDLAQGPKTTEGDSFVRAQVISRSACPGLQRCVLGPWPSDFKTKRTRTWITAIHHSLPGSLELLLTQRPDALCDVSVWIISGDFQGRLWAYSLEHGNW